MLFSLPLKLSSVTLTLGLIIKIAVGVYSQQYSLQPQLNAKFKVLEFEILPLIDTCTLLPSVVF